MSPKKLHIHFGSWALFKAAPYFQCVRKIQTSVLVFFRKPNLLHFFRKGAISAGKYDFTNVWQFWPFSILLACCKRFFCLFTLKWKWSLFFSKNSQNHSFFEVNLVFLNTFLETKSVLPKKKNTDPDSGRSLHSYVIISQWFRDALTGLLIFGILTRLFNTVDTAFWVHKEDALDSVKNKLHMLITLRDKLTKYHFRVSIGSFLDFCPKSSRVQRTATQSS